MPRSERRAARTAMLLLLLLTLPAVVQAQFNYTTTNGTITITGYTGPGGAVTIPDTINGLPVTSIGRGTFWYCFSLTSVTIPNSVTSIGYEAFYGCSSLASVTLGNSVTNLGEEAFVSCTSLNNITMPNSVTGIGIKAFANCTSLTNVTLGTNVASIGDCAFVSCASLTSVMIPSSVTGIGPAVFEGCTSLSAITVDVLNPVYSSVAGVLFNKSQTTLNEYPAGKAGTSYTISNSVTHIAEHAFSSCTRLTSVTIGNSVISIGSYAFGSCASLTTATIPNNVTSIGFGAFSSCSSLTNATIPDSVTSLGDFAFGYCSGLASVTIGNRITNVAGGAFCYCSSVIGVTIPDSVTSIGSDAFAGCTSLTSVTIGNSVASIGDQAFDGCPRLSSVTIPNSVTSIGHHAFSSCASLTEVYFKGNAPSVPGSSVFSYDNNPTVYYLPGTTRWGATYGGRPTALWIQVPTIQTPPQSQTAEATSAIDLWVDASSPLPLFYLWYLNHTNLIICSTHRQLELTNVQFAQSGAYTVVASNVLGAAASAPAMLNVIAPVERRPVPGIKVTGEPASFLNVDYADSLDPTPNWTPLGSVSLTNTSQYYFDLTLPLPPQRFYRAWQTGTPRVIPSLDMHLVPAITLTGNIGASVRLDYINRVGPTDAWGTLATVPLTNTSQLYFDISALGQPQRLYRLVQVP